MRLPLPLLVLLLGAPVFGADDRKDLLVADFEGDTYAAGWKATGTAFGPGPAQGTLPGQMAVSGFLGKGLVNSFRGGDDSTGTLTSPEFTIDRKYLNFLVGGGKHPNKTCINLLVGGKVVRTATGPNDRPGGSERLDWHTWDVAEFAGKKAVIQIVDEQKGAWGHINVDHIVQSDAKKQAEPTVATFAIEHPYLRLPVKNRAPVRHVKFLVGQATVREFDIELATDGKPDFWATADVSAFRGKKLAVEVLLPPDVKLSALAVPSDEWADADRLYQEKHRPLFHFTSRTGWLNDPNGLVFANGAWHLFYQHNPFGREWGNMHWGHATSTDLFRWKEQGIALYPKKYGDWAFSGSAVVDTANTSGWGTKEKPPLVLAYTSTGRGECIAFSTDNGKTWTEHNQNPVVRHAGRDPKIVWHEKARHWVMAVYDEADEKQWIAFYTSPDLKTWSFASRIEGFFECPDLFELPVREGAGDPRPQRTRWVLYAADGKYVTGDFDGKEFKPEHKGKKQLWYGNFYAAQTFDHAPARRVQIGWARGVTFPGTSFNQQMTVPVELTLHGRGADHEPRLSAAPVPELGSLRDGKPVFESKPQEVKKPLVLVEGADALDISLDVHWRAGGAFTLDVRGTKIVFDPTKWALTCKGVTVPLARDVPPGGGTVRLRVLVDRGSVEVFTGETALSVAVVHDEKNRNVEFVPQGSGPIMVGSAGIYRLKSAWEK